jgi:hypothetical protein
MQAAEMQAAEMQAAEMQAAEMQANEMLAGLHGVRCALSAIWRTTRPEASRDRRISTCPPRDETFDSLR